MTGKTDHPWEKISLEDYENHMSLDSVKQLQTLNSIMRDQFAACPAETAMILGVAGGNGLEHISPEKYRAVFCVDINQAYLRAVAKRYGALSDVIHCLHIDLVNDYGKLPQAQLIIANLLIEYIGYTAFQRAIRQVAPKYVSCVIQLNADEGKWVSDSPYLHAFDALESIHHQIEESALVTVMKEAGYSNLRRVENLLPNGKILVRLDFISGVYAGDTNDQRFDRSSKT